MAKMSEEQKAANAEARATAKARKDQEGLAAKHKDKIKAQRSENNPITRKPANSFTKAYREDYDANASVIRDGKTVSGLPVLARPKKKQPIDTNTPDARSRRRRQRAIEAAPDSPLDAPIGYQFMPPVHTARLIEETKHPDPVVAAKAHNLLALNGALGAVRNIMPPQTGPAINEPHAVPADTTIPRRFEDNSRTEHGFTLDVLRSGGHSVDNPMRSLIKTQTRNTVRVLGEHAAAGTNESVSQLFYGGEPTTHIHDERLAKVHYDKMKETQRRFATTVDTAADAMAAGVPVKPNEKAAAWYANHGSAVGHTSTAEEKKDRRSLSMAALAAGDTSPNTKWMQGSDYPNLNAADEVLNAARENRDPHGPTFAPSRPDNVAKAHRRVRASMLDGEETAQAAKYGNPDTSPKTLDFRGALTNRNAPTARAVLDVMEGKQMFPAATTRKAVMHEIVDANGNRVGPKIAVHPNTVVPPGARPIVESVSEKTGKPKYEKGSSEVEELLNGSGVNYVHGANDFATRTINTLLGGSRGRNYADNVHAAQAARWGSEQEERTDLAHVSNATQYPVVRDWASEGGSLGTKPSWLSGSQQFDSLYGGKSMEPQWTENPNTAGTGTKTLRKQPYLVTPSAYPH